MPRIKIGFAAAAPLTLPLDYNYSLYLGLRRTLFAFLQERQPRLAAAYKKGLPPFTFSQLLVPRRRVELGLLHIDSRFLGLQVSSPDSAFIDHLTQALYRAPRLKLLDRVFTAHKLEPVEEPDWNGGVFRMLSPLVLIVRQGNKARFVRADDPDLGVRFAENLAARLRTAAGTAHDAAKVSFALDAGYVQARGNVAKLITVHGVHYKAIMAPFSLHAPAALLRFAYQAGIGDKTQFGFGMIERGDDAE
jgi:CRISPR-associated endoribonuclease Cas6